MTFVSHALLNQFQVLRYRDSTVVWFHDGTLPKNAERTIFAALYFRRVGQGC